MRAIVIAYALLALGVYDHDGVDQAADGWLVLFDGHSLHGWTQEQGSK